LYQRVQEDVWYVAYALGAAGVVAYDGVAARGERRGDDGGIREIEPAVRPYLGGKPGDCPVQIDDPHAVSLQQGANLPQLVLVLLANWPDQQLQLRYRGKDPLPNPVAHLVEEAPNDLGIRLGAVEMVDDRVRVEAEAACPG